MSDSLEPHSQIDDSHWMREALQLAKQGQGRVEPNPMVGCVLVRDGFRFGTGYHTHYGGPHAERVAIEDIRSTGFSDRLAGSTAYVTLEPCCHHGKTPPCTDLLIQVGVHRVVVALEDPFQHVAGKGIAQLRAAGIQVAVGEQSEAASELLAPYLKRTQKQLPWVIGKWAMSLDGRIATNTGDSQWISNSESRAIAHQLRSRVDAILVGRGTAETDDPLLTARLADGHPLRTALRVVVDSQLSLDKTSQLAQTAELFPTLLWAGPNADPEKARKLEKLGCHVEISSQPDADLRLEELLRFLVREHHATNVLVEGGSKLLGSLFDNRQLDECHVFIAPKIMGGTGAIAPIGGRGFSLVSETPKCYAMHQQAVGDDVYWTCRIAWKPTAH